MTESERVSSKTSGKSVAKATGLVSGFTALSRVTGLVRDMMMSLFFGTSLAMSAFVVAFTIPNLFRRLFGEGALSAAFVPVFVKTRTREGDAGGWDMLQKVMSLLALTLTVITLVGWTVSVIWGLAGGDVTQSRHDPSVAKHYVAVHDLYLFGGPLYGGFECLQSLCSTGGGPHFVEYRVDWYIIDYLSAYHGGGRLIGFKRWPGP